MVIRQQINRIQNFPQIGSVDVDLNDETLILNYKNGASQRVGIDVIEALSATYYARVQRMKSQECKAVSTYMSSKELEERMNK